MQNCISEADISRNKILVIFHIELWHWELLACPRSQDSNFYHFSYFRQDSSYHRGPENFSAVFSFQKLSFSMVAAHKHLLWTWLAQQPSSLASNAGTVGNLPSLGCQLFVVWGQKNWNYEKSNRRFKKFQGNVHNTCLCAATMPKESFWNENTAEKSCSTDLHEITKFCINSRTCS